MSKIEIKGARILVTGAAGFIGAHLCAHLLSQGAQVTGVDSLVPTGDRMHDRLAPLRDHADFQFIGADISHETDPLFAQEGYTAIVHLAARYAPQAGWDDPAGAVRNNVAALMAVLTACQVYRPAHLIFASGAAVYGLNRHQDTSEYDAVDHPVSPLAAGMRAAELLAHSFAHHHQISTTGLRFFSLYGPAGHHDSAISHFVRALFAGTPLTVYHKGQARRSWTYIDDAIRLIARVLTQPPLGNSRWDQAQRTPAQSVAPFKIYNVGSGESATVTEVIRILERHVGVPATLKSMPPPPGDIRVSICNPQRLLQDFADMPRTSLEEGLAKVIAWYRTQR
ncbi:MAG: NAD-dependent epimerase/dehydratase family protein [Pseudomonadota bacterium]